MGRLIDSPDNSEIQSASPASTWRSRVTQIPAINRGLTFARRAGPYVFGALAAFVGLALYNQVFPPPAPLTTDEVNDAVAAAMASATPPPAQSALVYAAIRPSLVLIQTQGSGDEHTGNSLGSGVVVDLTGAILTSLHVVDDAQSITVTFADGTQSAAQIVVEQPEIDIAVLQALTPPAQIVPAVLGNPNALNVGDDAYVVGNPFGLYSSMSAGVVSGFDRIFEPEGSVAIEGLIQVDAAINPGNSGGPLLNRAGQVVGIVTGIINPTEQEVFIGIGFAVPITVAGGAAGLPPY